MIKATSLHSREDLARYLQKNVLRLSCDYFITIESKNAIDVTSQHQNAESPILVQSFDFPKPGVSFSSEKDMGHLQPGVDFGSQVNISFYIPNKGSTIFDSLFEEQFSKGVPKFIPISELPVIHFFKLSAPYQSLINQALSTLTDTSVILEVINRDIVAEPNPEEILTISGCRFTRPVPTISLSSDAPVVYSCTVTFEDFSY